MSARISPHDAQPSPDASDPVVIAGAARTPIGGFQGVLSPLGAPDIGAVAIRAAVAQSRVAPSAIDEVLMGCVLAAGQGQAPARQAALAAGLAIGSAATTVNKMCGSGMKAVMIACDMLMAGSVRIAVAGGMESMSNAPYLLPKARAGIRLGHDRVLDHMFYDGLEDAYDRGRLMGSFAEDCAARMGFSRKQQDDYAAASLQRARTAIAEGLFAAEIAPVTVTTRTGELRIDTDEQPGKASLEKIPTLRPAFANGGTVTAANSSSISDGAAAMVLLRQSAARQLGLTPLARIVGHSSYAAAPADFPTAPVGAIQRLVARTGWDLTEVDLFEINEAFAVVALAAMQALDLPHDKVNVNGGACALGHPIGASGARVIVTLLAALSQRNLRTGIAAVCIGGGEATAIAIERMG